MLFDFVSSKPEIEIRQILDRSDQYVNDLEYMEEATTHLKKLKTDKEKQDHFKSGLTTMLGAVMQKQECWEQCRCIASRTVGSLLRDNPMKDITFM